MNSEVLAYASEYSAAGLSVIPIKTDGTKGPALNTWKPYQQGAADSRTIQDWFSVPRGIGIVCGAVSGNLLVIDFDDPSLWSPWWEHAEDELGQEFMSKLPVANTPSGGYHVFVRCDQPVTGNQKLATRKKNDGSIETLIETRGEGGYVIAAGSPPECHPQNDGYAMIQSDLSHIPEVDSSQLDSLLCAARQLTEHIQPKKEVQAPNASMPGGRPGDEYNARTSWEQVLTPAGWTIWKRESEKTYWRRPGKSGKGGSATTNHKGSDKLVVFSTNAHPFEIETSYDKFGAYAQLNHGGDFKAAAQALARQGFGKQVQSARSDAEEEGSEPEFAWQEPILFGEIETPEIPATLLPSWLGQYAGAVARYTQTPPSMAVMLALSVVATCVQRFFEVSAYGDDYREPLSLWTVTALPPASRKTAVFNSLTFPLDAWEEHKAAELKPQIEETEARIKMTEQRINQLQSSGAKEPDKAKRDEYVQEIAQLKGEMPQPIKTPCLWTADVTPEALQGMLADFGERMSLLSDEGGIFEVISGLYNDGKSNVDVFLKAHAGAPCRVNRGTRRAFLKKPALSFGLAVQPIIISELASGSKRRFRGNGMLARFLFCIPKSNIGSRTVRRQDPIAPSTRSAYETGVHKLLGLGCDGEVRLLRLSDAALEAWLQFSQEIESKQGDGGEYEAIQDWTGKLPGAVLRIAGLCHLAKVGCETLVIDARTQEQAIELGRLLIVHAKAAFELMGGDATMDDAKHIFRWIVSNRLTCFRQNELHKTGRFSKSKLERLSKALDVLIERNIISGRHSLSTKKPTYVFYVNPYISTGKHSKRAA